MSKHILYLALLLSTSCGNIFQPSPLQLPEATQTGANTAGFRIGEEVVVPIERAFSKYTSHTGNAQTWELSMFIDCVSDYRKMHYEFDLILRDSLILNTTYLANAACGEYYTRPSFCVTLEDKRRNITYAADPNHAFSLTINHYAPGPLVFAPSISFAGDTMYTHRRSVICSGTFKGVLRSSNGRLINLEDGRFDFQDVQWLRLESYEIPTE